MTTPWSLVSTIEREEKICDLAQQELKNRCRIFENRYHHHPEVKSFPHHKHTSSGIPNRKSKIVNPI